MTDDLNFAQGTVSNDYRWTERAFDLMTEGVLAVTWAGSVGHHLVARGRCPRCAHDVDFSFDEKIVVPQGRGGTLTRNPAQPTDPLPADGPQYVTVTVLCQCREDHHGRPPGAHGCGIVFNVDILGR